MPVPAQQAAPLGIYVHVPFCAKRCPYCDFATVAGEDDLVPAYLRALLREIRACPEAGRPVATIFFGGGTPTHPPTQFLTDSLTCIRTSFQVAADAEITVEANPRSADGAALELLRDAGVNRLCIGVQSLDDRVLSALGRVHTAEHAIAAVRTARSAGFDDIAVDLMYGVPGQTIEMWQSDLHHAVALPVTHISTYGLTVEDGTPFGALRASGALKLPDEDVRADMYEQAIDILCHAGLEHYEVSNFAHPGRRSRHNMGYWTDVEYVGFGAGAASYVRGLRTTNARSPAAYAEMMATSGSAIAEEDRPTPRQRLNEALMLGLRLRGGVAMRNLIERFGSELLQDVMASIERLRAAGMVEPRSDELKLTHAGLLVADAVIVELMAG
jgi:oxygen-independent coproporphyrinogen-3 oxidase